MINHDIIAAALARERHATLLAEAQAARQARSARPRRPRADATVAARPRLFIRQKSPNRAIGGRGAGTTGRSAENKTAESGTGVRPGTGADLLARLGRCG